MVFSTAPVYHQDPPNWHLHLQQNLQQGNNNNNNNPQPHHQQQVLPPPPPAYIGGGGGSGDGVGTPGSIRPGSMSDRARLAKIPQPEAALKCPRCESTNTKFCYFNNYNLSQPRHFCKMCRRYWTRGGALRNVPVGGGCRRNKKSKSSKSKAGASSTSNNNNTSSDPRHNMTSSSSTSTDLAAPRSDHEHDNYIMGHHNYYPQQPPQLPFLSSLQNLTHFGGLNLRGINPPLSAQNSILSPDHQWTGMQQFPFLAGGFEPSPAGAILGNNRGHVAASSMPMMTSGASSRVCDQVKMEETLNSGKAAKLFLGMANDNNDQYYSPWGGGSSTWNNPIGSADDDDDSQMPGQQLSSSTATAHFL